MELVLRRIYKRENCTIGVLYYYNELDAMCKICDTLEDKWRDLAGGEKKVNGRTCIPDGEYDVTMNVRSPKYVAKFEQNPNHSLAYTDGFIPRLLHVPYFDGVLIHTGNTDRDTEGCVLVGKYLGGDSISGSVMAFKKLYDMLDKAKKNSEKITIKIE